MELSRRGHEVYVLAASVSIRSYVEKDENVTIYRIRSILVERKHDFRISPKLLSPRKMQKIIKEVNPDVIHINHPAFLGQTAMKEAIKENIPIVGTSHFMPENLVHYLHLPKKVSGFLNQIAWARYAQLLSKLDAVIAPTEAAADLIKRFNIVKKLKIISNGINLEELTAKGDNSKIRKKYKIPNKPIILFVGRVDKEKKIDVLFKAMTLIRDKVDFHTLIVGSGSEVDYLKGLSKTLGISDMVTFTGYVTNQELPLLYSIGDVFVMPSIAELQSLVIMEAMTNSLPIIGADAIAIPHLVRNDKNGYLFKPSDEKDLAEKLLKILKDKKLRERMAKESYAIIKKHDIHLVIKDVEKLYGEVIAKKKKSVKKPLSDKIKTKISEKLPESISSKPQLQMLWGKIGF